MQKITNQIIISLLFVLIPNTKAFGFSLAGATQGQTVTFTSSTQSGVPIGESKVETYNMLPLDVGGTPGFLNALQTAFQDQGWSFNQGNSLTGSFDSANYYVCNPKTPCGSEQYGVVPNIPLGGNKDGIGASLILRYKQHPSDGTFVNGQYDDTKVRWIQVVTTSLNAQAGVDRVFIDNKGRNTPYYQTHGYFGNYDSQTWLQYYYLFDTTYNYYDPPKALPYTYNQHVDFQLYLAYETEPKKVTIFNGVSWGWKNTFTPADYIKKGTIIDNEFNEFAIADLPPSVPFVAWIDNLTGAGEPRSLEMSLAAVDPKAGDRVIDYSDGENLFDDVWGTGISSLVGKDGKIKLKVSSSSSFTGDYTLYVKVGEKNFSFLSSQSTNSANSALAAQAMFASDNFYSATTPGENGTLFTISSADTQSVPEPGTIVGLAGIGILGFLSRKKKKL